MNLVTAINVFLHVAQARSFVDAGRMLGISASAVGKGVARLEEHLGVRLFHRSTRSLTLTPEGMLFFERGKRVIDELEQATLEMKRNAEAPHGLLRISLPIVGDLFAPLVAAFCRRNPGVDVDMVLSNRPVNLIDEGFDLAIRTGGIADSGLMTRRLATFRMQLVASQEYIREHGEPLTPRDLQNHKCIRMRMPQTGRLQRWVFDDDYAEVDNARPSITCNDLATTVRMTSAAAGIAYVPQFAVTEQIANGSLVALMTAHVKGEDAFRALWPAGRLITPKVRAFIDFAASALNAAMRAPSNPPS